MPRGPRRECSGAIPPPPPPPPPPPQEGPAVCQDPVLQGHAMISPSFSSSFAAACRRWGRGHLNTHLRPPTAGIEPNHSRRGAPRSYQGVRAAPEGAARVRFQEPRAGARRSYDPVRARSAPRRWAVMVAGGGRRYAQARRRPCPCRPPQASGGRQGSSPRCRWDGTPLPTPGPKRPGRLLRRGLQETLAKGGLNNPAAAPCPRAATGQSIGGRFVRPRRTRPPLLDQSRDMGSLQNSIISGSLNLPFSVRQKNASGTAFLACLL